MSKNNGRGDIVINTERRRRTVSVTLLVALGVVLLGGSTAASYYVDALWFESLGLASVFWTRLSLQAATFAAFALATFLVVYGVFRALKPDRLDDLIGGTLLVNRRPMRLPIDRFLELVGLGLSLAFAAIIGSSMTARWMTLALYWRAPRSADMLDPIFGRPLDFYLFTLPALQLISGWLLTLSVIACLIAAAFVAVMGGAGILAQWRSSAAQTRLWRGLSTSLAAFFVMLAVRAYLGRFEHLFQDGTIFSGVTYTDAHVTLGGTLMVCVALLLGAVIAVGCRGPCTAAALAAGRTPSGRRLLPDRRRRALVRQRLYRRAEPAGARTSLHCAQYRNDAAGLRARPHRDASRFPPTRASKRSNRAATRRRSRTYGCGTGARCRIRCVRFRKSAPTMTFRISTSIDTRSAVPCAR